MKAILVIDKSESCTSCLLGIYNKKWFCLATNKDIDTTDRYNIPTWCPLKPLPLKRKSEVGWYNESQSIKTHELTCYDKGWNDCIDFIEGGQDALEEEN